MADAGQPSGVAAAIEVTVAGQIWAQKGTLDDSEPADPHYTVQLTEDGYLHITFGDGEHGRRLPTGSNNVMVTFRTGAGLAGKARGRGGHDGVSDEVATIEWGTHGYAWLHCGVNEWRSSNHSGRGQGCGPGRAN